MNACKDNKCNVHVTMNYIESLLCNSLQRLNVYVYDSNVQCELETTHTAIYKAQCEHALRDTHIAYIQLYTYTNKMILLILMCKWL